MQLRGKVYKTHCKAGKDVGSSTDRHSNHTRQTIREKEQAFKLVWIKSAHKSLNNKSYTSNMGFMQH